MSGNGSQPQAPPGDRVLVGLCHHLNSQIAAANAYIFLLRRRDRLAEYDEPLQERMDDIARSVHLLRSLCVEGEPHLTPVSLAQLAETASDVMKDHPDGPVRFVPGTANGDTILRVDWARALRTLVSVGAWAAREREEPTDLRIQLTGSRGHALLSLAPAIELSAPTSPDGIPGAPEGWGLSVRATGPRSVEIEVSDPRR